MAITIAEQYFLKALNGYPYELEEAIENLNYALGYDDEHAGANCLMGMIYMEQLNEYEKAEDYFIQALSCNPHHLPSCEKYIRLAIWMEDVAKADKLIKHTLKVKGADVGLVLSLKAYNLEIQKKYEEAIIVLYDAIVESYNDEFTSFLESKIDSMKTKLNKTKQFVYYIV